MSPQLANSVYIEATLVGAGGVGGGAISSIQALGSRISGSLALVDLDVLTTDNLNYGFRGIQTTASTTPTYLAKGQQAFHDLDS